MKSTIAIHIKLVIIITSSAFLTSCASIVSRNKWPLAVDSKPEGVHVSITTKKERKYLQEKHRLSQHLSQAAASLAKKAM